MFCSVICQGIPCSVVLLSHAGIIYNGHRCVSINILVADDLMNYSYI